MPTPKLRIFNDDSSSSEFRACSVTQVPVALGDVLPLLLHAMQTDRVWLNDFADETIEISQDLYEILLAYKQIADSTYRIAS